MPPEMQGCIKFLISPLWKGKFIKSVGEEYQMVEKEGNIIVVGKNITWKKNERGSNIIFHIVLRLLGRTSSW